MCQGIDSSWVETNLDRRRRTLPADRQTAVDRMAATSPRNWSQADLELVTENQPLKTVLFRKSDVFGSNYAFARERAFAPLEAGPGTPAPTFAKGGFSVVWGAAMLPADRSDLHDWPTGSTELEPSYARVLDDIPLSARHDSLETTFPLFKQHVAELEMSESSKAALHDLERVASIAEPAPFLCGQARLAWSAAIVDIADSVCQVVCMAPSIQLSLKST